MPQLYEDWKFLLNGCSGKFRNKVLFNVKGNTYMKNAPGSYNKIPTPKQAPVRSRWTRASQMAKAAMGDPVLKARFKALAVPPQNAYNVAVKEYMAILNVGF